MDPLRLAVGRAVKRLRRAAGATQRGLAAQAGVSPYFLGRLERGQVNVSLDVLARLATALRVDVAAFFDPVE